MYKEGKIVIVLGASNSGKTTMFDYLKKFSTDVYIPIYYTTRELRKDEVQGQSYHFVSDNEFNENLKNGKILFSYQCHGFNYGIPKEIRRKYQEGKIIFLGVSRKLIPKIKSFFKNVIVIFLDVKYTELEKRMIERKRETDLSEISVRLNKAKEMIEWSKITNIVDIKIDNEKLLYVFLNKILYT